MIDDLHDCPFNCFQFQSRIRCFCHIINLVARTLTHQFDNAAKKVHKLNRAAAAARGKDPDTEDLEPDDDSLPGEPPLLTVEEHTVITSIGLEDWIDDLKSMSEAELRAFATATKPVYTVLCKVCTFINSFLMSYVDVRH